MHKYKVKKITVSDVESILCNKCGAEMKGEMNTCGLTATVHGGYDSVVLHDGVSYHFDLCESCLVWLFGTFKHSVEVEETKFGILE